MSQNGFVSRADIEHAVVAQAPCHLEAAREKLSKHHCDGCGRELPDTGTARIAIIALGEGFALYGKCCSGKARGRFVHLDDKDFACFARKLMGVKAKPHPVHAVAMDEPHDHRKLQFHRTAPAALHRKSQRAGVPYFLAHHRDA